MTVILSVLGGLLLLWLALLIALAWAGRRHPDRTTIGEALRLLPDVVRLLRRLVADRSVPRSVRVALVGLLVYLLLPIDLVPDMIPVIGYADDAIVVAVVLRVVARRAGAEALERNWPGAPQGLRALKALARL